MKSSYIFAINLLNFHPKDLIDLISVLKYFLILVSTLINIEKY